MPSIQAQLASRDAVQDPAFVRCQLIPAVAVFLAIAWVCVLARLYTRQKFKGRLRWDDWTILISVVFYTVYCAAVIIVTRDVDQSNGSVLFNGLARDVVLLSVAEQFYILAMTAIKISIGIFFLYLTIRKWQRSLIYGTIVLSTVVSIPCFFHAVFQCGIYHNANELLGKRLKGQCGPNKLILGMSYMQAATTILTDLIYLLLPFAILHDSHMRRREKLVVKCILTFASVSVIASGIRTKYINWMAIVTPNVFQYAKWIALWSSIELGVAIAAGGLITLRPLFTHLLGRSRLMLGSPRRPSARIWPGSSKRRGFSNGAFRVNMQLRLQKDLPPLPALEGSDAKPSLLEKSIDLQDSSTDERALPLQAPSTALSTVNAGFSLNDEMAGVINQEQTAQHVGHLYRPFPVFEHQRNIRERPKIPSEQTRGKGRNRDKTPSHRVGEGSQRRKTSKVKEKKSGPGLPLQLFSTTTEHSFVDDL